MTEKELWLEIAKHEQAIDQLRMQLIQLQMKEHGLADGDDVRIHDTWNRYIDVLRRTGLRAPELPGNGLSAVCLSVWTYTGNPAGV